MTIYANGMGGGIGRVLWPILEKKGAVRIAASSDIGRLACDLRYLAESDGDWFAPGDIFVFRAAW